MCCLRMIPMRVWCVCFVLCYMVAFVLSCVSCLNGCVFVGVFLKGVNHFFQDEVPDITSSGPVHIPPELKLFGELANYVAHTEKSNIPEGKTIKCI